MLTRHVAGDYGFIAAPGRPFSGGILADRGFDLVRARFARPLPLEPAFAAFRQHLQAAGRPASSVTGFELRIPEPLTADGFDAFNRGYIAMLAPLGAQIDGLMGPTRTNVAPSVGTVKEPSMFSFTYTVPTTGSRPAFVVSGVAEAEPGEPAAMLTSIFGVLSTRLTELGVTWEDVTAMQLYGVDNVQDHLPTSVLSRMGGAAIQGIHWYPSLPPVKGLRLEIDVRSVGTELILRS